MSDLLNIGWDTLSSFLDWTKRKIMLHHIERVVSFDEGDIWWASIGENIGSEEQGKNQNFERPVLVLKRVHDSLFMALPMSSKVKPNKWRCTLTINSFPRDVLLSQVRSLSTKRLIRRMDRISSEDHEKILKSFIEVISK